MAYYCQLFIQISVDLRKVLLCDLEIAKLMEAPEIFVKKRSVVSVDIYSLGCLLVKLFGRRRVWPNHDQAQITMKLLGSYNSPPVSSDISHQDSWVTCFEDIVAVNSTESCYG